MTDLTDVQLVADRVLVVAGVAMTVTSVMLLFIAYRLEWQQRRRRRELLMVFD